MKKFLLMLVLGLAVILAGCAGGNETGGTNSSRVPSGNDCAENLAYLQEGVNKYRDALGTLPVDVNELLQIKEGKGPFVEKVPACPSGNLYVIENGIVKEAPKQ
jgi:hypothetical protein